MKNATVHMPDKVKINSETVNIVCLTECFSVDWRDNSSLVLAFTVFSESPFCFVASNEKPSRLKCIFERFIRRPRHFRFWLLKYYLFLLVR